MADRTMGPPKDVEPSELWTALASQKRPCRVVDFPRKDDDGNPIGQVAIWPLKKGEIVAAKAGALETARRYMKELETAGKETAAVLGDGYDQIFNDACACEMIFRFCRDAKDPRRPVFPTAKSVMSETKGLTTDECDVLLAQYTIVQHELGPIVAYMTPQEMDAWLERLAVGGRADPLASLSSVQKNELLMHSARRLWSLLTDRSSLGTPPEENT